MNIDFFNTDCAVTIAQSMFKLERLYMSFYLSLHKKVFAMNAEAENEGGQGRSQRPNNPLFNMRERLFHALFYRVALTYARAFPKPVRRILEFAILLKVI